MIEKSLTPEAKRALAEAEARRVVRAAELPGELAREIGGTNGDEMIDESVFVNWRAALHSPK